MGMKKVLLIGDSIRMGYDVYVKNFLADSCEVYFPAENCRFAQYVLRYLGDWKKALNIGDDLDLIHWNVGLWDTLEWFEDGCLTPLEFYAYFVEKICKRIKLLFPNAKVIFATSTPVLEHNFLQPEIFNRKNADIRAYNEVAVKICKEHGFGINDLFALIEHVPESYYTDTTHLYTPEGTEILANAVVKSICETLEITYEAFTLKDYETVKEIIGI